LFRQKISQFKVEYRCVDLLSFGRRPSPVFGTQAIDASVRNCRMEMASQVLTDLRHVFIGVQINVFALDAGPQLPDEDVVQYASAPIHAEGDSSFFEFASAEGDSSFFEFASNVCARELRPLIAVAYFWLRTAIALFYPVMAAAMNF
jgi:hypothetical protein